MNINNLSLNALTAIRNDINGTPTAGKFKTSREKALEQVQKLAKAKGISLSKQYDENGRRVAVEKPEPKAKAKKAKAEKPEKQKRPVVRKVAEQFLLEVVGKDDDGRPVGMPYAEVLEKVHAHFKGEVNTSVACLRWYVVRMRERGDKVPSRPRPATDEA